MPKTKLHQLIAVVQGKKAHAEKVKTEAYHLFQKPDLFNGLNRKYEPRTEEGERLPEEKESFHFKVNDLVRNTREAMIEMLDAVVSQDATNCHAKADVVVLGETLLKDVPAVSLIFLEKQLTDLATYVSRIPTLKSGGEWNYDQSQDLYRSVPVQTIRQTKVQEPIVLYPATEEHPAQTQLVTKDVTAGTWTKVEYSTAWPVSLKNQTLERIRVLKEAVVKAREEANAVEVVDAHVGEAILSYIFK
jgi:hypothetical protein